ncbi:PTS sugar transporter subunit IIA [Paenibacillus motobuensis]|uniref:BglG family transcription antiterminator n=1 Tax=Paenibacillus TaxID=44249 RepID=UPI00203DE7B2|nr:MULTISPECIES: PTS sugar transporter subunit IIA [Paenibacillus]MCM3040649.1 PTS sugar transporter subunit IIA [Paenibacillus lutimineralis]MCM3647753.1 PTS sugar transporter subunit IIA [Paenibacillus motobuensis]
MREYLVLQKLQESRHPLTVSFLASSFDVNERTIRNDLQGLDAWCRKQGMQLCRKPNVGVWLETKGRIIHPETSPSSQDFHRQIVYSPDDRQKLMALELLLRNEAVLVKEFEFLLGISKSTALRDLETLERTWSNTPLQLVKRPNFGVLAVGEEREVRNALFRLLTDESLMKIPVAQKYNDAVYRCLKVEGKQSGAPESGKQRMLDVWLGLRRELERHGMRLTDEALATYALHMAIAAYRIRLGEQISLTDKQKERIRRQNFHPWLVQLLERMMPSQDPSWPEEEVLNMAVHLAASSMSEWLENSQVLSEGETSLLAAAVHNMVEITERFLGLSFQGDGELYRGLANHLAPMIHRLRYGIASKPAAAPAEIDVKQAYQWIFYAARSGAKVVEELFDLSVPDSEVAHLSLYIGAAVERKKGSASSSGVRAVIVCGSGVGTSQMLEVRLMQEFPEIRVRATCSVFAIEKWLDGKTDLFLATVPFQLEGATVIECSPFLDSKDVFAIRAWLTGGSSSFANLRDKLTEEIVAAAAQLGLRHPRLSKEVGQTIASYFANSEKTMTHYWKRSDQGKMLDDLLTKQTVLCHPDCSTWEDAVKTAGQLMEQTGAVDAEYTEAMMNGLRKHGPYMVVAPGVALLHARPQDGVKEVGMSLQIVPDGVAFGHPSRDPVRLVFAFGTTDSQSHLQALSRLMSLFNDEERLSALMKSSSVDEALTLLHD